MLPLDAVCRLTSQLRQKIKTCNPHITQLRVLKSLYQILRDLSFLFLQLQYFLRRFIFAIFTYHQLFSKSDYFTRKNVRIRIRIIAGVISNLSFKMCCNDFLGQIDRFSPYFFGRSDQGELIKEDLSSSNSNINVLLRIKHFLFHDS